MGYSLKDIAKEANISIAAVSLALNGKPGVSMATRRKVLSIAQKLNTKFAAELHNGVNNGTLAFLKIARHGHTINQDHEVFIANYIEGLSQEARANNFSLEVIPLFTERMDMEKIVESVQKEHFAGLIVLGTELSPQDFTVLSQLKYPIVVIDSFFEFMNLDFVDMDNYESVFQIVTHFVKNGHRKIGMLRSDTEVQNFRLRERAFSDCMNYYKFPEFERFVFTVESTFHGAYRDTLRIFKKETEIPSALFASNDIIAYGCMKAIKEMGLRIPGDVSIIGFDDLPMSAMTDPPLTSMMVNKIHIGRTAIKSLVSRIETNQNRPPMKTLVGGQLMVRESIKNLNKEGPVSAIAI